MFLFCKLELTQPGKKLLISSFSLLGSGECFSLITNPGALSSSHFAPLSTHLPSFWRIPSQLCAELSFSSQQLLMGFCWFLHFFNLTLFMVGNIDFYAAVYFW
jgi:hypothetical protein